MLSTVEALARAYSLSEILPADDPRVRAAAEDGSEADEDAEAVFEIRRDGFRDAEGLVEDPDGCLAELSRDLWTRGARELRLSGPATWDDVRALIGSLREGGEAAGDEGRGALEDLTRISLSFDTHRDDADSEEGPTPSGIVGARVDELFTGELPEEDESDPGAELLEEVDRYLDSGPAERSEVADQIRQRAEEARARGQGRSVALSVERLAAASVEDPEEPSEALELARELLTPGVAAQVALDVGAERDEVDRERLIRVCSSLGGPMAAAFADTLAETSDRAARRAYLEAMVALGSEGKAEAERMLDDGRWFVVRNGIGILGGVGGEEDVHHLTSHLAHDDARVRRETVMALARIGGEDAGMLLLGMVDDPDPDVRASVATALGALGVEKAGKPLLERLEKEEEQKVQVQVIRALGALGDPGAVSAIEKRAVASFFSRPPVPLRVAAYRALASIGTPHAMELVEAAGDDRDDEVRTTARALLERREREGRERGSGEGAS